MKPLAIVFIDSDTCNLSWESFNQNMLQCLDADLAVLSLTKIYEISESEFWKNAKYQWALPDSEGYGLVLEGISRAIVPEEGSIDWACVKPFFEQFNSVKLIYAKEYLLECIESLSLREVYSNFVITNAQYIWRVPHPPIELLKSDELWLNESAESSEIHHAVMHKDDLAVYLSTLRIAILKLKYWHDLFTVSSEIELMRMSFSNYLQHCFFASAIEKKIIRFPSIMYLNESNCYGLKKFNVVDSERNQKNPIPSFDFFSSKYFSKLISFPGAWNLFYSHMSKNKFQFSPSFLLMDRYFQTLDHNLNINQVKKLNYSDSVEENLADTQNDCHLMVHFEDDEAIIFDSRDESRKAIDKAKRYTLTNGKSVWRLTGAKTSFLGLDASGRFSKNAENIINPPLIVDILTMSPIID